MGDAEDPAGQVGAGPPAGHVVEQGQKHVLDEVFAVAVGDAQGAHVAVHAVAVRLEEPQHGLVRLGRLCRLNRLGLAGLGTAASSSPIGRSMGGS